MSEWGKPPVRAVLVAAHPGHELRVFGWLGRARPRVLVVTDGSGHGGRGRVDSTRAVLDSVGARAGSLLGELTDREAYRLILDRDVEQALGLALRIGHEIEAERAEWVVSDAIEGFNPVHDLVGLLTEVAVDIATPGLGYRPELLDYPLEAAPDEGGADAVRLELDEETWLRKLAAARAYRELQYEVERGLDRFGEAFRFECLKPVRAGRSIESLTGSKPHYERVGERRRAAGIYSEVLRLHEHFLPLATALRERAAREALVR